MRSALVLPIPEADPIVGELRLAHDPSARAGMRAHVTLLFPFVPAARLEAVVVARLEAQLASERGGELCFDRMARFPGVSYLALADAAPIAAMIRALAAAWPESPPYEGRYPDVVPHLTVAHGTEQTLAAVEAALAPALPLRARVDVALLAVEDAAGRWREHTRFALGVAP